MALVKNRNIYKYDFGYHVLMEALYNRRTKKVNATYYLYKDKAAFKADPTSPVKKFDVVIPFSAYNAENLQNVIDMTESATKRSIQDALENETNWFFDAVTDNENTD